MKKDNYFIIDGSIPPSENMKKLVNLIFQKEISFDILRGVPPNYSNLYINGIHFDFENATSIVSETAKIKYLRLSFDLNRGKYKYKKKSIRIIEQKIDTKYLRGIFDNFKEIRDANQSAYLEKRLQIEETEKKLAEVKERNNIKYPKMSLYSNDVQFQLVFNKITEDEVDQLVSHWNRMKKFSI